VEESLEQILKDHILLVDLLKHNVHLRLEKKLVKKELVGKEKKRNKMSQMLMGTDVMPVYDNKDRRVPGMYKKGGMAGCSIKNGCKSKSGGLTAKGRRMINRKTGSNLKPPQPKGGKRKKSYCARSAGQMKMHNISCSKTPDKRICKARRKWKC
jgi:hypothetical protein